jgi:hypothetical protein
VGLAREVPKYESGLSLKHFSPQIRQKPEIRFLVGYLLFQIGDIVFEYLKS